MTQFFASTRQETELFEAFFSSGMEESISPFITPSSRSWGKNIRLKGSIIAAIFLALSVACLFLPSMQPLAYLLLLLAYFFAGIPSLIKALYDLLDF
jgi:Cd2+/Zn2+-exporting ATPase